MSRVLVTGGAGFVGRHVTAALSKAGHSVTSLDVAPWPSPPDGATHVQGSILDLDLLDRHAETADVIIHLAANANLWARDTDEFDVINHRGTRHVLAAARRAGVARTVVASSLVILSAWNVPSPDPISENTPMPPVEALAGPYCRSKYFADQAAAEALAEGQSVVTLYCGAPVGSGDVNFTPPTVMIRDFINGRVPAYLDCTLSLVPVTALAEAFVAAAFVPSPGDRYIVTGPSVTLTQVLDVLEQVSGRKMPRGKVPYLVAETVARLAEPMAAVTGKPPQASLAGVRLAKHPRRYETSRAECDLGWSPGSLEPALREAVTWLKQAD